MTKFRIRKRIWIPIVAIALLLWLVVYAPGPIEGVYDSKVACGCEDDYSFSLFKTNAMMFVYKTHPPAQVIGHYRKSNSTWLVSVPGSKRTNEYQIEPHLFYVRIRDLEWRTGEEHVTMPRILAFWKPRRILNDPEQWKPKLTREAYIQQQLERHKSDFPTELPPKPRQ